MNTRCRFLFQMRVFYLLPFLHSCELIKPPEVFKASLKWLFFAWLLTCFHNIKLLLKLSFSSGFPLWSSRKVRHGSRWSWLPPMGRLGRGRRAQAGLFELIIWHTCFDKRIFLEMSLCFNMRYTALDSWSEGQKTILRLFQVKQLRFKTNNFISISVVVQLVLIDYKIALK